MGQDEALANGRRSIPKDQKMIDDLTAPENHVNIRDCIVLESKESMQADWPRQAEQTHWR